MYSGDETYTAPRFCGECGRPLSENAAFCGECGTRVKTPVTPREDLPQTAPEVPEATPDEREEPDFGEIPSKASLAEEAVTYENPTAEGGSEDKRAEEPMPSQPHYNEAMTAEPIPPVTTVPPPHPGVPVAETRTPFRTAGDEIAGQRQEQPLRTGELVMMEILSYVPILNIVLFFIWMFQSGHPGRARLAQAKLLVTVTVFAVVVLILTVVLLMARYGMLDSVPSIRWESVD